jgi:hypothetical protein
METSLVIAVTPLAWLRLNRRRNFGRKLKEGLAGPPEHDEKERRIVGHDEGLSVEHRTGCCGAKMRGCHEDPRIDK